MAAEDSLERFVEAQAAVFSVVCGELAAGRKRTHWMWFVFPQLRGLGSSPTATHYGLAGRDEALAYWRLPLLGPRLRQCAAWMLGHAGRSAREILGSPDDLKLRSCMTLFDLVAGAQEPLFAQVLVRFYDGRPDQRTLDLLGTR